MLDFLRTIVWKPAIPYVFVILLGMLFASSVAHNNCPTHAQTNQGTQQQGLQYPESSNERIANYTLLLAFFTALLAIGSIFQLWALVRADKTARIAAEGSKAIGEKQLSLTGLQADILEKQKEIDRLKYFSEYRPKLEIRFVRRSRPEHERDPTSEMREAEFVVINTGTAECIVLSSCIGFTWFWPDQIPSPPDFNGADIVPHTRLKPGDTDTVRVPLNGIKMTNLDKPVLVGWIAYADGRGEGFGDRRTTYFGRIGEGHRFIHFDDWPDLNLPDWNMID